MKKLYNDPTLTYEYLIDHELFTQEELDLATNLNGFNMETLNDCLYVRFGYRSLEQMLDEDPD